MTYVQRPTELENLQEELIHVTGVFSPGTAVRVLLGVAPRDMWLEHVAVWYEDGNLAALTGGVASYSGSLGGFSNPLTAVDAIDFNAGNSVEGLFAKGEPGSNFVARGDPIVLLFGAAPSGDLADVCVDCQFTTRKL